MSYLTLQPFTRVRDTWISTEIDATPVEHTIVHPLVKHQPNSNVTRWQADFYRHIALDIVAESVYNYPYPYVTEKTLRPIACKRMFIVVGAPGILKLLHSKNFITFSDIIDESYDLETDNVLRWKKIEQAILNFVDQPIETIRQIVKDKSDVLEHNYQTLIKLERQELKNIYDSL